MALLGSVVRIHPGKPNSKAYIRAGFFLYNYITKILHFPILQEFMNSIFYGEDSYKRSISTAWRYISSDVLMDEGFTQCEDIVEFPSFEYFARDGDAGSGDDRHISIEHELSKFAILDDEKYLDNISTDAVMFPIANCRIFENSFIGRVLRVFDDEILRRHYER